MNGNKWINKKTDNLFRAILALEDIEEAQKFFRDLLTEKEILEFANRWEVAQKLAEKVPYSKIEEDTGMSSTTIARISKWLNSGVGGYRLMIDRLVNHNHHVSATSFEGGS